MLQIQPASAAEVLPLRTRYREEVNGQIVHDSIHRREGWALTYRFVFEGHPIGFASVAVAGPWKDKPTVLEFFLLPEQRTLAFRVFETFVTASGARFFEAQTNCGLLAIMAHVYGRGITSEKIVFRAGLVTTLPSNGARLRCLTPPAEIREALERRQGGGEWLLELDGQEIGKGGILFHYNRPYGDIYMEVAKSHRRQGFGAYLVQELKHECYGLGAIPCARCNPDNIASRSTLQKAGFVPCAHILIGPLASENAENVPRIDL